MQTVASGLLLRTPLFFGQEPERVAAVDPGKVVELQSGPRWRNGAGGRERLEGQATGFGWRRVLGTRIRTQFARGPEGRPRLGGRERRVHGQARCALQCIAARNVCASVADGNAYGDDGQGGARGADRSPTYGDAAQRRPDCG